MTPRNQILARFGLSMLLSSGLLLAPSVAWSDDAGVDAADDVAVVDAGHDVPVTPGATPDAATPTDGAPRADGAVTDGGNSDGAKAGAGGSGAAGAAGATVIPEDDAGCSTAGRADGSNTGLLALLATAAAFFSITTFRRRRSRR